MIKWTTVKITARTDVYGAQAYSVMSAIDGGIYRSEIGSYEIARAVANTMEARNTAPIVGMTSAQARALVG